MCESARRAEHDFARLVSRLGSPLYWDRFLTQGFQSLSARLRRQLRDLDCWRGFNQFLNDLAGFVKQPDDCTTLVFSQSRNMIRLAAEFLTQNSKRILATDLEWPPYLRMLRTVAQHNSCELVIVPLSEAVFKNNLDARQVTHRVLHSSKYSGCDGVFLSDITHLGVRMPLGHIIPKLKENRIKTVVDGAQAINHRPVNVSKLGCDLYLAGTQKWFQAYHPLRFAIVGTPRSDSVVRSTSDFLFDNEIISDPLSCFCEELAGHTSQSFGETVNVLPLITAAGALAEIQRKTQIAERTWKIRKRNARVFAKFVSGGTLMPQLPHASLQSGISLLTKTSAKSPQNETNVRDFLQSYEIVASGFPNGTLRFSMPDFYFPFRYLSRVHRALNSL